MGYSLGPGWVLIVSVSLALGACSEEPQGGTRPAQPAPKLSPPVASTGTEKPGSTPPVGMASTAPVGDMLPPGHPPIGGPSGLPAGHPPMTAGEPANMPTFTAPPEWLQRPKRMFTERVYALPKVEGDPEDGDLTISALGPNVPLDMNVTRWCGQFGISENDCPAAAKRRALEGTKYPTTLVEISGTFLGGGMMAAPGEPKPGYRLIAAEIKLPDAIWFVRLLGPQKTVEHWRESVITLVRQVK